MTEKARLTQEQADAIEEYKRCQRSNHYQESVNKQRYNLYLAKCLLDLTSSEFMDALYIGYEVEPVFEIGQWVKSTEGKGIGKIIKIDDCNYYTDFGLASSKRDMTIRHATPEEIAEEKERRWWASQGREILEFREGDVVKRNGRNVYIVNCPEATRDIAKDNIIEIVCFAKDRLDVKTNE